jgi:uncharacterized protein
MTLAITAPYAAALTLLLIVLTQLVVRARGQTKIPLGHGDDSRLLEASRRQMNFVEQVPMTLILMVLAEAGGAGATWLHVAGLILLVARIVHPFGITVANPAHVARIAGTVATHVVQLGLIVLIGLQYFS